MKSTLILLPLVLAPLLYAEKEAPRPNIVLIMSDDMGYSDLGCYGGEIETPQLDKLAANGLRYTRFYNTGRCCPTRASLLTGLYAHQAGIGQMTNDLGQPGYRGDISSKAVTLAEALKPAGYRTYMSGKWHVTTQLKPDGDKANWPRQRGFDRFYGTIIGAGSLYDPWTLTRENEAITPDNDPLYQPDRYHYTEAISDNGGCAEQYGRKPLKHVPEGIVPMKKDELQTKMIPDRTREGLPVLTGPGVMPGPSETYIAYGQAWANVSNTPFRLYKSNNHEGGIATPLIAHWPKGITARGEFRQRPGHLIDIMPTLVELAGADYTGGEVPPMEGLSLTASFTKDEPPDRTLLWEHYDSRAILRGKWKLVGLPGRPWELYDIAADRTELHDLSQEHPETAKELAALWEKEAHRTLIYPRPKSRK